MSEYEYNGLLFDISEKLDVNKLPRLLFICRKDIAEGSEEYIHDVRTLFKELEKQNRIGIDRLENLKEILTQMKKPSLRKKVEEFEIRRKAQSIGIVSSLKRAATCLKGAIKLVCNFRTMAGGLLVVTSGMALRRCSSLEEFVEVFNKVVLVSYSKLVEISEGSLCFTVQAETSTALKEVWDMYKMGTLQSRLQEFLVTDEIKQLVSGEDVEVTVHIDEQEYKAAYLDLMLLQKEASDAAKDERLGAQRRSRRNSDFFLCFKSNEDDLTLMKLEQTENKWAFECQRRHVLEEEIKKLRMEIAVVRNAKRRLFWQLEESAQESEDLERRRKRPRRNSDSSLYCKARDQATAQSEGGAEIKHLDSEKYDLVQSYLQNIQETHSMTTETSDSGIRTHGEPSDLEMQDTSGDFSLFAVFANAWSWWDAIIQKVLKRLASGIPAKIKFFMGAWVPIRVSDFSETLVVNRTRGDFNFLNHLMLDILNKRWQTMDLISMMEECKRSAWYRNLDFERLSITDRLSSRPKFKKEEDPTDCA